MSSHRHAVHRFLERTTGKVFKFDGPAITLVKPKAATAFDDLDEQVQF
jgi:hypothetical protein